MKRLSALTAALLAAVVLAAPSVGASSNGDIGGLNGFFGVTCNLANVAQVDPVVSYGVKPSNHLHDFFGQKITETTTAATLAHQSTNCRVSGDQAGYWMPSPVVNGVPSPPRYQNEYWFDGGFKHVETIPFGLSMVAGNHDATGPQLTSEVWYYCGRTPHDTPHAAQPYDCRKSANPTNHVIMVVRFPNCWNGSPGYGQNQNATPNMAYPVSPGVCPAGYPHAFPVLEEHVHLSVYNGNGFALSSGSAWTLHADFLNAWRPALLQRFIDRCINAHHHCSLNQVP